MRGQIRVVRARSAAWSQAPIRVGRAVLGFLLVAGLSGAASSSFAPAGAALRATAHGLTCSDTWPVYQHDAGRTAANCSTLSNVSAATLLPAWFDSTPGAVTAEPIVSGNTVYAGDSSGLFHAVDQATGASRWTFNMQIPHSCFLDAPTNPYVERHGGGFGAITSSANVSPVVGKNASNLGDPTVYFGGGATLFALDAVTGACEWAQDFDPNAPTSAIEIESSPMVDTSVSPPEVIVGDDDNSGPGHQVTGLFAFNAKTGALIWRYEPERDVTLYPSEFGGSDALTLSCGDGTANAYCNSANVPGIGMNSLAWADACGDVWASPVLDTSYVDPAGNNSYQSQASTDPVWQPKQITHSGNSSPDGLVVFGTGNCAANPSPSTTYAHDDYAHSEADFGLDPVTGVRVWNWFEPPNAYNTGNPNEQGAGDDDFGSTANLIAVPNSDFPVGKNPCPAAVGSTNLIIQGSKSGFAYGVCEQNGVEVWGVQAAQPGQLAPSVMTRK